MLATGASIIDSGQASSFAPRGLRQRQAAGTSDERSARRSPGGVRKPADASLLCASSDGGRRRALAHQERPRDPSAAISPCSSCVMAAASPQLGNVLWARKSRAARHGAHAPRAATADGGAHAPPRAAARRSHARPFSTAAARHATHVARRTMNGKPR